ncbi:CLUMA_CG016137, isoform A [Clunio marinus]|uniref:peptidylprolyl isomerase n=1 Tax=Clunio marinus TaxID=568069 RepID=A0A1J1IT72_9DIPT|nr:CLUMA_CG016137, isoform A [Clunio marinus]
MENSSANFRKPIKLSDLLSGTTFEFSSVDEKQIASSVQEEIDELIWHVPDEDLDKHKNPCSTSFTEWKAQMIETSEGVFKKVLEESEDPAANYIDLNTTRVTYHRNMYMENEDSPFDSTYLNNKTDVICLAMNPRDYLEGFLEALSTMKEGEHSIFIISYKKMFKETGCEPRINPKADILLDLKVIKVELVGDEEKVLKTSNSKQKFKDIKGSVEETRLRALDHFHQKKWSSAIELYQRILQNVDLSETDNEKESSNQKSILSQTHLNLAICYNKKEDWNSTMQHISAFKEYSDIGKNPKALFTLGRALMKVGELDKSLESLKKAFALRPFDKTIINELEQLQKEMNQYNGFVKSFHQNLMLN